MKFRNLDDNHDWTFGRGTGCYVDGNQAIGLNIKTRILSWLNDCFFALDAGIDWYNRLGSKDQRELLEFDLRRIILQSKDVTGILSLDSNLIGRNFTANFSVQTIYSDSFTGEITIGI